MDLPGEKLVGRLWDTLVDRGIGGLLTPWQTKRTGRARIEVRREERLALAQADRDVRDITTGRKSLTPDYRLVEGSESVPKDVSPSASELGRFIAAVRGKLLRKELRAEVNVAKAVLKAETELEGDGQEPPDRAVDEDWLYRWRDLAGNVSSEELQSLWGRVLAGEIKSPGTFSLRALDFLKNLSQEEARRIEKLAPFVIDGGFVHASSELLDSNGINFSFLLGLEDLGVVAKASPYIRRFDRAEDINTFSRGLFAYNKVLAVTHEDASRTFELRAYKVTAIGEQILGIGRFEPNEEYLRRVGEQIKSQGFKVSLAKCRKITETKYYCFDSEEI